MGLGELGRTACPGGDVFGRCGPAYLCPAVLARRQPLSAAQRGDPAAQVGKGLFKAGWLLWWWGGQGRRKREGGRKDEGRDQRSPAALLARAKCTGLVIGRDLVQKNLPSGREALRAVQARQLSSFTPMMWTGITRWIRRRRSTYSCSCVIQKKKGCDRC